MKWETSCCIPSRFYFVYGPASTYMYIISHQCNEFESDFKQKKGIQNILIHQQASYLVTSLLLTYASSLNVWGNVIQ